MKKIRISNSMNFITQRAARSGSLKKMPTDQIKKHQNETKEYEAHF